MNGTRDECVSLGTSNPLVLNETCNIIKRIKAAEVINEMTIDFTDIIDTPTPWFLLHKFLLYAYTIRLSIPMQELYTIEWM